ncbi:MAG: pantoate--beta-alanine ligase [Mariniblastus sp.]|jgi:pantoate--beta-alanine ligase
MAEKTLDLDVLTKIDALKRVVRQLKNNGQTIGLVPTMGALHEGHLSLVRESVRSSDQTIVTIFVNPTQFAPTEDLDLYPQTLEADVARLQAEGVDFVFAPARGEIYPASFSSSIVPPAIAKRLEGEFRPSHFAGVATVVLKLLNLTEADVAFFGQKDFQQVMVIKQMVADLNVPTEIKICPIVRDDDGLALSSRNAYLTEEQRVVALSLSQTLNHVEEQIRSGQRDGFEVITEMRQMLIDAGVESIDYAVVANPNTLATVDPIELPIVALIAAHVGNTRLIDNRVIA